MAVTVQKEGSQQTGLPERPEILQPVQGAVNQLPMEAKNISGIRRNCLPSQPNTILPRRAAATPRQGAAPGALRDSLPGWKWICVRPRFDALLLPTRLAEVCYGIRESRISRVALDSYLAEVAVRPLQLSER